MQGSRGTQKNNFLGLRKFEYRSLGKNELLDSFTKHIDANGAIVVNNLTAKTAEVRTITVTGD